MNAAVGGGRRSRAHPDQHPAHRRARVVALARAAGDAGIDGLQLGVPVLTTRRVADDLLRLVEQVGRETSLPLMIYSTWWEGGLTIDGALLLRLAELPQVEAVKWSAPTYDRFTKGLSAVADRLVVIDNQAMHVWGHVLGANGFVTHISNFWPEYPLSSGGCSRHGTTRRCRRSSRASSGPGATGPDAWPRRAAAKGRSSRRPWSSAGCARVRPVRRRSGRMRELMAELDQLFERAGVPALSAGVVR